MAPRGALAALLVATSGCAPAPRGPTHVPAFPGALAPAHAPAWAAFELQLRADGSVVRDAVRTVGWEASGAHATLFVALRNVAGGTTWEPRDGAAHDVSEPRHLVLVLDGSGQPLIGDAASRGARARVSDALRARRRALEALGAMAPANAHALDCVWMSVDGLRSGAPFLHDDVDGWFALEPSLREVERRDGGMWVCRVARSTHQGQFVFLDKALRLLGIRKYILGE